VALSHPLGNPPLGRLSRQRNALFLLFPPHIFLRASFLRIKMQSPHELEYVFTVFIRSLGVSQVCHKSLGRSEVWR